MFYYDVYVLCEDRSPVSFNKFRSSFLRDAEEATYEYEFPRFAENKEFITRDLSVILEKLYLEKKEDYAIYWRVSLYGSITAAMMFFTDDGYVIYGLTVAEDNAENMLEILKKLFSSEIGGITFEQPPPLNSREFIEAFRANN
jgi:hypothetical protein